MTQYTLYFDGCSKGNPGPAGAGSVLYTEAGAEIDTYVENLGNKTNNYAEYNGLIGGLRLAIAHKITHLSVFGDSMLVVKQMRGEWRVKTPTIVPLYKEACELAKQFTSITYAHVYRDHNTRADELSNQALLVCIQRF
jgi:ribonuclease HI